MLDNGMNGSGETGRCGLANRRLQPLGHVSGADFLCPANGSVNGLALAAAQTVRTKAVRVGTCVGTARLCEAAEAVGAGKVRRA